MCATQTPLAVSLGVQGKASNSNEACTHFVDLERERERERERENNLDLGSLESMKCREVES